MEAGGKPVSASFSNRTVLWVWSMISANFACVSKGWAEAVVVVMVAVKTDRQNAMMGGRGAWQGHFGMFGFVVGLWLILLG